MTAKAAAIITVQYERARRDGHVLESTNVILFTDPHSATENMPSLKWKSMMITLTQFKQKQQI